MVSQEAVSTEAGLSLSSRRLLEAFRWMLTARLLDEKLAAMYRAGKIHGGVFLGKGQEALSVALGQALRPPDIYAPLIRDGAGRLAFGETIADALRTCLGSPKGPMRARDGNVHRGRPREGCLPMISHLGAMISTVGGMLLAKRIRGEKNAVGATCIGDGGVSTGAFHEAVNLAAVEKLPLVIVIANNHYAYSTPIERQFAGKSFVDKAVGYGVEGCSVDGTDLLACCKVIRDAVCRARNGAGPQLIVGELLRLCGHGEHDDAGYIEERLKNSSVGRDCLEVAAQKLRAMGILKPDTVQELKAAIVQEIETAVALVDGEGRPDPFSHDWCALSTRTLADPPLL